jgi:two-component system, chemotaxis family, protein-glutamate methylesterase/glutaminase
MTQSIPSPDKRIRVLVVDDSPYLRKMISHMLESHPQIQVVGTASDGLDALQKAEDLQPDVITLDLHMDNMDGVDFLRAQMERRRLPVVIVSIASESSSPVVGAMEAGAVEFVHKPTALALDQVTEISEELVSKVLIAAAIPEEKIPRPNRAIPAMIERTFQIEGQVDAVLIGVSTGGPQALRYILPRLPADFPAAIAIVLHMPQGYTGPLSKRLNDISNIEVLEAEAGMLMQPGRAILARAGSHLKLERRGLNVICDLSLDPIDSLHRPSVDVLFKSAADVYKGRALAVVLTGMGSDGLSGAAWIKAQGGNIITEAESSCVVYGMPRAVVEAGLSDRSEHLNRIPEAILECI